MITDLILNQFRPSIFCFATEQAKKIYPHYRSTVQDAFSEASKKLPFQVRLLFGPGIDKNINFNDINEEFDEKIDEMLLEASLISIRSCYSQSVTDLNHSTHSDLSYNEKVDKYHKIYDTILSTLFSRTRFCPYFFLPDIPTCFLIIVANNKDLEYPQGIFPPWSIPTIKKIKKTTMLLFPENQKISDIEKQKFRNNLVNTLSKWLTTTFISQYSSAVSQIESDYIREWTGFAQALVNFFNARDDPKTSLVMLKAYADLKAQQGNFKEAELAYRKVCTNIKQEDDKEMLSESLFLLGCVQIIESRNPAFFVDFTGKVPHSETLLNDLRKGNPINYNAVDLKETVSILASAKRHALSLRKDNQAFLCAMLEFEVRRVIKAAPYRAFMFSLSTNIGKDSIRIRNNPSIQFVSGFNTNQRQKPNTNPTPSANANANASAYTNQTQSANANANAITNTNASMNTHSNSILKSDANSGSSNASNSNVIASNAAYNSLHDTSLVQSPSGTVRRRCAPSSFSLCLGSAAYPVKYRARGILRVILPFLLEMSSLYSRRRKQALFLTLAAHAFLIRRKRIISSSAETDDISRSASDTDLSASDDDNFGGFLDPFFAASMLSDASDLLQAEKWPLIRQTVSLRAISINENLVELLVTVVGSRKLMLPDQTIKITSAFTHGEMQKEEEKDEKKENEISIQKDDQNEHKSGSATVDHFKSVKVDSPHSDTSKTATLYSNSPLASSFLLALPCGFIEAYVSDVYSHGFERCPPPSMRNNSEWFSLSERMFGSFNRGSFFSQLYRHSSSNTFSTLGTSGGTRNVSSSSIYAGQNSRLRCECCVGEQVHIKVALKMRNVRYDLFAFSLLVNEFPLIEESEAESAKKEVAVKHSIVKSSMNIKASKFCFVECKLEPKKPGRFEVYGVKFEWGNVTHLECPFTGQDQVIVLALPEYAAPRLSLQVLPKQRLVPDEKGGGGSSSNDNNNLNDNSLLCQQQQPQQALPKQRLVPDEKGSSSNDSNNLNDNSFLNHHQTPRRTLSSSMSSYILSKPSRRILITGQIFPLKVRLTNTCGFDLASLSMLIYTSGPIECKLIEPRVSGVFGRYSLSPLKSGTSVTIDVAVHALHDETIENDPTRVNNGHSDEARLLLLFPFWTSPESLSKSEASSVEGSLIGSDVFPPVPRFDFVELDFDVIGHKKDKKGKSNEGSSPSSQTTSSSNLLRSKSNSSIMSKLKSKASPSESKPPKPKKIGHPLLNLNIEKNLSSVSILCPPNTLALGFSPFDSQIIQNHIVNLNGRSATLNIASLVHDQKTARLIELPSFCTPFVPSEKVAFWFTDNESVFYCFVENELKKKEKQLIKKKMQQEKFNHKMVASNINLNTHSNLNETKKFGGLSMFSFLGGVEVSASFSSKEIKFNSVCQKLKIVVKNVSGVDLNDVCIEIIQKKNDEFVQCILCGKMKNYSRLLKNDDSILFDLNLLMFSGVCKLNVNFVSDKIKTLLPIEVSTSM